MKTMIKRETYQEMGMVKKIRWSFVPVAIVLAIFLVTASAFGGGLALSGVGARAIGMGGAFRAVADDWSAAYWNPAGLAQMDKSDLSATLSILSPRPSYAPQLTYSGYDVGYKNGATRYPKDKDFLSPNFAGFVKINSLKNITAGVAFYVPYALGSEWDLFEPIYRDAVVPYPKIDHKADLQIMDIHPTISKAFMENKLLAGFGVSFLRGSITYRKTILSPTGLPRPHDNVAVDATIEGTGWGYGANFGILYKQSDKIQFGISGKTPSKLSLEGTLKNSLYRFFNPQLKETLMAQAQTHTDSMRLNYLFPDVAEISSWKNDVDGSIKLPGDIGLGMSYKINEKLKVSCDLTYTFWARLDSIVIHVQGQQSPIDPSLAKQVVVRTLWDNTIRLSLGGEYQLNEPLTLRAGFYYDPSPIPDNTFSPLIPDVGTKYSGNLGATYKLRGGWDASYTVEYVQFAKRDITTHSSTMTPSGIAYDNYTGAYKEYFVANFLSVNYRF
jgi:long-chain fatty acid transport protein